MFDDLCGRTRKVDVVEAWWWTAGELVRIGQGARITLLLPSPPRCWSIWPRRHGPHARRCALPRWWHGQRWGPAEVERKRSGGGDIEIWFVFSDLGDIWGNYQYMVCTNLIFGVLMKINWLIRGCRQEIIAIGKQKERRHEWKPFSWFCAFQSWNVLVLAGDLQT
jgi:hypothetical protein